MSLVIELEGVDNALIRIDRSMGVIERDTAQVIVHIADQSADMLRGSLAANQRTGGELSQGITVRHGSDESTVSIQGEGKRRLEWLLNGTRPHVIAAKRGSALAFPWGGGIHFYRRVNHPGTQGRDVLSSTFESIRSMADFEATKIGIT